MKIAFFGLPLAGVLLARDGHEIVYAGVLPEKGLRRLTRVLGGQRVHVLPDLSAGTAVEELENARPDLTVSWFWPKRIPAPVLGLSAAVGVHPSLLPRHRGPDPYFHGIDEGDAIAGVTAHLLDENYDTGAILAQRSLPLDPTWNAWQLARALDRPSLSLLREVAGAYAAHRPPAARPQDERSATQAPQPREDELAVQWTWTAERIERRIRAAAPWPGMWTEIGDEIVILVRARATTDFPRTLVPAEAAVRGDGVAVVRAGEGAIELLEGRSEKDDSPLTAADLARIVAAARDSAAV